ncbi:LamG domain-containing protein [Pelosinus propionicus]|uniref:Concanavalin A-like lectin/glucanases superfamily protein n=1 Tax=Pelosinus propionicus DSM 13327 TaxID=1123291 RepID=A0A1I4PH88_9FIRM|nr:LamG domain-containing protein [Pelosinus propionicus]SFM26916.1 Concanavalin A-like lectin/glucanases superfamily protein [Pelosinus propionicus DSM 13327]
MYEMDQYTVSLLHFEDGIKDESGKVWAAKNGANVSSELGEFSGVLSLNGSGQYITTPSNTELTFGGDYTVDFWVYMAAIPSVDYVVYASTVTGGISASISTTKIAFGKCLIGDELIANVTVPIKEWVHIAITRASNIARIFMNGAQVASGTVTTSYPQGGLNIGVDGNNSSFPLNGYIDEFRISNIARWTSDFQPDSPQPSTGSGLLRITMNDSSEREYRLSIVEIEKFIKWYDRTVGTGNTCYAFDDIVDLSKEYLSFEKIISFKVIPLKD